MSQDYTVDVQPFDSQDPQPSLLFSEDSEERMWLRKTSLIPPSRSIEIRLRRYIEIVRYWLRSLRS